MGIIESVSSAGQPLISDCWEGKTSPSTTDKTTSRVQMMDADKLKGILTEFTLQQKDTIEYTKVKHSLVVHKSWNSGKAWHCILW